MGEMLNRRVGRTLRNISGWEKVKKKKKVRRPGALSEEREGSRIELEGGGKTASPKRNTGQVQELKGGWKL